LRNWKNIKKVLQKKGLLPTLVEKYTDGEGKKRWKGTKKLRSSEHHASNSHK
jgi:hypothetical protein